MNLVANEWMVDLFSFDLVSQMNITVHFYCSDKNEVKQENNDDDGKMSANSQKRTASEVCLSLKTEH